MNILRKLASCTPTNIVLRARKRELEQLNRLARNDWVVAYEMECDYLAAKDMEMFERALARREAAMTVWHGVCYELHAVCAALGEAHITDFDDPFAK
jgi:hypothetical protein